MNSQFGVRIRELREKQNLYLRQVAPLLEMDTAQLSKIEKGVRPIKKEQIPILAENFNPVNFYNRQQPYCLCPSCFLYAGKRLY